VLAARAAWDYVGAQQGSTELTTILPGAVFGPVLSPDNLGSVQIVQRLLRGRLAGLPRLGFSIVDVRDLADLHADAMIAPEAAGQRFLAAGDFLWLEEMAAVLRLRLGERAAKVPTRRLPDAFVRALSWVIPPLRSFTADLGRRNALTSLKSQRVLGFVARPAAETIVDCAASLLEGGATS
jgi:nucleoside-diphosphate-sugar epimerase